MDPMNVCAARELWKDAWSVSPPSRENVNARINPFFLQLTSQYPSYGVESVIVEHLPNLWLEA